MSISLGWRSPHSVNDDQRFGLAQHHSATHLLNASLRNELGEHVRQAGSLVDINRLRFDFTHGNSICDEQLKTINDQVNQWIQENHSIHISEEPIEAAKSRGAIAMFGEKYDDIVRVVDIPNVSMELCGGTHVRQTNHLQVFQIISEGTIAAGTRRIEAIVGEKRVAEWKSKQKDQVFKQYIQKYQQVLQLHKKLASTNQNLPDQLTSDDHSMAQIQDETNRLLALIKTFEKDIQKNQRGQAGDLFADIIDGANPLKIGNGVGVFKIIDNQPIPVLKDLADRLVSKLGESIIILGSTEDTRAHAVVKVSPSLLNEFKAPNLIKELTAITGGGGGGRDHMAQAGGVDASKLNEGIEYMSSQYLA